MSTRAKYVLDDSTFRIQRDTKDSSKRQKTEQGINDSTKSTKDPTKGHKRLNREREMTTKSRVQKAQQRYTKYLVSKGLFIYERLVMSLKCFWLSTGNIFGYYLKISMIKVYHGLV